MISIGVLNAKGGVGKTTFSTMLAIRAARDFARVGLVDLDPQQSAIFTASTGSVICEGAFCGTRAKLK